jgi:hypothetical protein
MSDIAKWLLQISWSDLAIGIAAGLAATGLLTFLALRLRRRDDGDGRPQDQTDEKRRLLLFCGDAKALADLAIQRHMSDLAFVQRFQAQPCYEFLSPHFSETFRQAMAHPGQHRGRSDLADACRRECEQLQQQWTAG